MFSCLDLHMPMQLRRCVHMQCVRELHTPDFSILRSCIEVLTYGAGHGGAGWSEGCRQHPRGPAAGVLEGLQEGLPGGHCHLQQEAQEGHSFHAGGHPHSGCLY